MPSAARFYTAEDIRRMPEDGNRYEVIDGELLVTPAPGLRHQRAARELFIRLHTYVTAHGLGEVFFAPVDVEFGATTLVEPDILFVHRERTAILTERGLAGAPDLAVEIISPSSERTDRGRKRLLYLERRVGEYWVVDCDLRQVETCHAGMAGTVVERHVVRWLPDPAVEPLVIDLTRIFS